MRIQEADVGHVSNKPAHVNGTAGGRGRLHKEREGLPAKPDEPFPDDAPTNTSGGYTLYTSSATFNGGARAELEPQLIIIGHI